jgi:3-dehydroquinate dehydratase/shikimate dehydrogenase
MRMLMDLLGPRQEGGMLFMALNGRQSGNFDMIYDPAETRLLQLAKQRGAQIIPGIEMFVHQAARQFEIWTGKPAPIDDMLRVVTLALQERVAARQAKEAKKK